MNLEEEVILTLLWQSDAFESATVCMLYLLLTVQMWSFAHRVCVCVCVRERERQRERERERERDWVTSQRSVQPVRNHLNRGWLQTHTSIVTVSIMQLGSPLGLELMIKLRTLLTVFNFESWSSRLWKGALHFWRGLWCLANHNALGQLANQCRLRLLEGGTL